MDMNFLQELNNDIEEAVSIPCIKEGKEYADYINAGFLSSFLSKDSENITESLTKMALADHIDESEICEALVNIQMSDLGSSAKLEAMHKIVDLYAESVELDALNEDTVMLEYAGDPEKNKLLRKLMEEMEKQLQNYYDEADFVITSLDQISDIIKKEAKKGEKCDPKKAAFACKAIYDKVDKQLSSPESKKYIKDYNTTFKQLKKICKSFSVKFNDVVIEDKKAFDEKLSAAVKKIRDNKKFTNWLPDHETYKTPAIAEFNEALGVLRIADQNSTDSIIRYVQPIYEYGYYCMTGYIGNINYIRRILGLEKVNTIFYRILNKVIKTKKSE